MAFHLKLLIFSKYILNKKSNNKLIRVIKIHWLKLEKEATSEVGHLNLGAGRIVYQELSRINEAINKGEFSKNQVIKNAFEYADKNTKRIHLMGLISGGGVHSHYHHLYELINISENLLHSTYTYINI